MPPTYFVSRGPQTIPWAQSELFSTTVQQAMALTHALGERHFWVDALCIIQDGDDKMLQLDAMASIFASARFTIVNAQGKDSNARFCGLPGISAERCIEQRVVSLLPPLHLAKPGSKQYARAGSYTLLTTLCIGFVEKRSGTRSQSPQTACRHMRMPNSGSSVCNDRNSRSRCCPNWMNIRHSSIASVLEP